MSASDVRELRILREAIHARFEPIQRRLLELVAVQIAGAANDSEIQAERRRITAEGDQLERELRAEIMAEVGPDGRILNVPRLIASIRGHGAPEVRGVRQLLEVAAVVEAIERRNNRERPED